MSSRPRWTPADGPVDALMLVQAESSPHGANVLRLGGGPLPAELLPAEGAYDAAGVCVLGPGALSTRTR